MTTLDDLDEDLLVSWGRFMLLDASATVLIDWAVRRLVDDVGGTGDAMAQLAALPASTTAPDAIDAFVAALAAIGEALPDDDDTWPAVVRLLIAEHDAGRLTLRQLAARFAVLADDTDALKLWPWIDESFVLFEQALIVRAEDDVARDELAALRLSTARDRRHNEQP